MLGQPHGPDASPILERLRDPRYLGQEGMRGDAADKIEALTKAITAARVALVSAGFVGPGDHGPGDPEINAIDAAL